MDTYTHGHAEPVLQSHRWRTAENSAAYLLPHLRRPGLRLLDVGCGPGTITMDLCDLLGPSGQVTALETGEVDVLVEAVDVDSDGRQLLDQPRRVTRVLRREVVAADRVLRHHRHRPAQIAQPQAPDVHAVEQNLALLGIVEARQQADQTRFAGASRAEHRHRRASRSRSARRRRASSPPISATAPTS